MGVPTTQNCCFCLSLRTGVIIIAVLLCIGGVGLFGKAGGSTSLIIQGGKRNINPLIKRSSLTIEMFL